MRFKKAIPLVVTTISSAALIITSCVQPPSALSNTGELNSVKTVSAATAKKSSQAFQQYKTSKKISNNASYRAQLNRVANKLSKVVNMPGAQWEFVVFDDPVPNAFAMPGGKVGVNSGMFQITRSDSGLAAVVGHEIAHVTLDHSGSRKKRAMGAILGGVALDVLLQSQGASTSDRQAAGGMYGTLSTAGMLLPFSRNQELQSDRIGSVYMAKAGYNPNEAVNLWKRFAAYKEQSGNGKTPEFLSTHPLDSTRIQELTEFMPIALKSYKK